MDGTYQPTTEPTSPNERTGCGFRSLWQRSRGNHAVSLTDSQSDSDEDENAQPKKSKRVSSKKNYRYNVLKTSRKALVRLCLFFDHQ